MDYVFTIQGGIGKNIAFTSFIRWFNEKYPSSKIIVISSYPEIFEHNPRIYRNLPLNQAYLFEDYIKGRVYRFGEVYQLYEFYREKNKKNICELWPKAYGFNQYDKNPKTEIFLTKGEEMEGEKYTEKNKPLITIQNRGGLPPGNQPNKMKIDSTGRDMPDWMAIKIVRVLKDKGYNILHLRGPNERPLPGTLQLVRQFRDIIPILKYAKAHIGIDSSWMHTAAVFKKPQLIFWGQTHKDNFGYDYPEFKSVWREKGMHCRPHLGMPDNKGIYQYESENRGFEWDYSEREVEKEVIKFLEIIE